MNLKGSRLRLGETRIPLDADGRAIPRWRSEKAFPAVSAAAVIQSELALREGGQPLIDPAVLKDKIVLFGFSAPGLLDLRPSPVAGVTSGTEIHDDGQRIVDLVGYAGGQLAERRHLARLGEGGVQGGFFALGHNELAHSGIGDENRPADDEQTAAGQKQNEQPAGPVERQQFFPGIVLDDQQPVLLVKPGHDPAPHQPVHLHV